MAARQPQAREVIFVEGYTEEAYLGAVRVWERSREVKVVNAKGQGGVLRGMQRPNLDAYARVWVVMDAERHPHQECERVRKYVERQKSPEYLLIVTSPKIETLLLAHYQMPTGDGARDARILREERGFESKRNLPSNFDAGAWRAALTRIARLELERPNECGLCVPQTGLGELVARLRGEAL